MLIQDVIIYIITIAGYDESQLTLNGCQIFQNRLEIEFSKPFLSEGDFFSFLSYFCFDSIPIVATHFSSDNATSE